jgi:hypothetical protein
MYHCHFGIHEDEGMMGQFVVRPSTTSVQTINASAEVQLFPNPAKRKLHFRFANPEAKVYYLRISNALGKVKSMIPMPDFQHGIDISHLSSGVYFAEITDFRTKEKTIRKFIIE